MLLLHIEQNLLKKHAAHCVTCERKMYAFCTTSYNYFHIATVHHPNKASLYNYDMEIIVADMSAVYKISEKTIVWQNGWKEFISE